jgi:hypothetical protein
MYEIINRFNKILINFDIPIKIDNLKYYLDHYLTLQKTNGMAKDYDIVLSFVDNYSIDSNENFFQIDNHSARFYGNKMIVGISNNLTKETLFIKRLLIDINHCLLEKKGCFFLHASSLVDKDKAIIFTGSKGAGKTTNMLYLLNDYPLSYSSNERVGLICQEDKIITCGNPTRLNVRPNTLKQNQELYNKLINCIDQDLYNQYKELDLPLNCSERLVISYQDLISNMHVHIAPFAQLKAICNLVYNHNIEFDYEEIDYNQIRSSLLSNAIDGVYPNRKVLNDILSVNKVSLDDILPNNSVKIYNIYQNNQKNNSDKIMKVLRK